MSNPMISRLTSRPATPAFAVSQSELMTAKGTAGKAMILLVLCAFAAMLSWQQVASGNADVLYPTMIVGLAGGFLTALIVAFRPNTAPVLAPIYAVLEGLFLGTVSALVDTLYPGIPQQAVLLTFAVATVVFVLYRRGVLRATTRFRRTVIAATLGILVFYGVQLALSFAPVNIGYNTSNGMLATAINLVTAGVAALFLVLDFDDIETAVAAGAPRRMEWYGAFALMMTLVWLYLELLQLLGEGD